MSVLIPLVVTLVLVQQPHAGSLHLQEMEPSAAGMDASRLARIDAVVADALAEKKMPGCVVLVARRGKIVHFKAYGDRCVDPKEPMTKDTVFDMASVTKPVATATSVMLLLERGMIKTSDRLADHVPGYLPNLKDGVTIAQLLTHTAGFIPDNPLSDYKDGAKSARDRLLRLLPNDAPGERFRYSDVSFQLLGELIIYKTGMSVGAFAARNIFEPLGMKDTGFNPPEKLWSRCAPTQKRDDKWMRGQVHDPRAYAVGGIAGHAGLFSTAADLAVYAEMMHGKGIRVPDADPTSSGTNKAGVRILGEQTVALMTKPRELPGGVRRCLGWDSKSTYSSNRGETFTDSAFGHGGFTGTGLWIDPELHLTVIFLSNRVHPDGKGFVNPTIGRIGTIAASAIVGDVIKSSISLPSVPASPKEPAPELAATPVPTAKKSQKMTQALPGIDVLKRDGFRLLQGKKVGLITNHTGRDRDGTPTIDLLHNAKDVKLVALFSPEHGIRGDKDEKVSDGKDSKTGLPIYSLYGETRKPSKENLQGIDTLVYDIQDIGCRFYTYISTLGLCMEAAAEHKLKMIVLDRPNPIGGVLIDGPMIDKGKESFVGWHQIPVQHGLTVGELAELFRKERNINVDLTVIKVENWSRSQPFDTTGLTWVNPSPNMRSLTQAYLYPGIGLLETTNLSVGRGTDTPFEVIGAPWLDGRKLAGELNASALPGVRFVPIQFTPDSSKFKNEKCGGINILITDRDSFDSLRTGTAIAIALRKLYPKEWELKRYLRLLGNDEMLKAIEQGKSLTEIEAMWSKDLNEFENRRKAALIYD